MSCMTKAWPGLAEFSCQETLGVPVTPNMSANKPFVRTRLGVGVFASTAAAAAAAAAAWYISGSQPVGVDSAQQERADTPGSPAPFDFKVIQEQPNFAATYTGATLSPGCVVCRCLHISRTVLFPQACTAGLRMSIPDCLEPLRMSMVGIKLASAGLLPQNIVSLLLLHLQTTRNRHCRQRRHLTLPQHLAAAGKPHNKSPWSMSKKSQ